MILITFGAYKTFVHHCNVAKKNLLVDIHISAFLFIHTILIDVQIF